MHFFPKELGNWRQALQREFLLSAEVLPEGQDRSRQLKNLAIFKNKYVLLSYIYRQTLNNPNSVFLSDQRATLLRRNLFKKLINIYCDF